MSYENGERCEFTAIYLYDVKSYTDYVYDRSYNYEYYRNLDKIFFDRISKENKNGTIHDYFNDEGTHIFWRNKHQVFQTTYQIPVFKLYYNNELVDENVIIGCLHLELEKGDKIKFCGRYIKHDKYGKDGNKEKYLMKGETKPIKALWITHEIFRATKVKKIDE